MMDDSRALDDEDTARGRRLSTNQPPEGAAASRRHPVRAKKHLSCLSEATADIDNSKCLVLVLITEKALFQESIWLVEFCLVSWPDDIHSHPDVSLVGEMN